MLRSSTDQIQWASHTDITVKGVSQEERVSAEERERVTGRKGLRPLYANMKPSKNELKLSIRGLFIPPPNKTRNTTERWVRT